VSSSPETSTASKSEIDAYSINATDGALTPLPGSPYTEPNSPNRANGAWDIAIHPSGNFLVIPNMCAGIVVYRIDPSTGTLTLVKGSPFALKYPFDVESIAMDPAGEYFWASTQYCHGGCGVTNETWKFNTTTGVPTYLEQLSFAGCGLLQRVDPSGKFVYAIGNIQSNGACGFGVTPGIWGLGMTRSNGSLHNISGSPWKSPNGGCPELFEWTCGYALVVAFYHSVMNEREAGNRQEKRASGCNQGNCASNENPQSIREP
jgi:hypothetical protein